MATPGVASGPQAVSGYEHCAHARGVYASPVLTRIWYSGLSASGLVSLTRRLRRGGVILGYHNVIAEGNTLSPGGPGLHASRDQFEAQIRWLRERCEIVSLRELANRFDTGGAGARCGSRGRLSGGSDAGSRAQHPSDGPLEPATHQHSGIYLASGVRRYSSITRTRVALSLFVSRECVGSVTSSRTRISAPGQCVSGPTSRSRTGSSCPRVEG